MGFIIKIIVFVITLVVCFVGVKINSLFEIPPTPILEDVWWSSGKPKKEDSSIREFKIEVPDELLKDLQERLKNTKRLSPPLEGIQQQYGFNTNTLNKILEFWKTKYDWREREKFLNQFPQYKTEIQGLNIHYLHVKPQVTAHKKVLPLLLLHGWPGSVREFYKIIPLLTSTENEYDFAFEVIAPSIPGFGFSDGAAKPGLGPAEVAVVFKNLMERIGHDRFYVQGGDWGAMIVRILATLFPDNVLGLHSNLCISERTISYLKIFLGSFYPPMVISKEHEYKLYPLSKRFAGMLEETGYFHIQATKPDTLGVALNDSPAGLAAYILEKFSTGTNPKYKQVEDAGLLEKFTYTELLDNIMLYWITKSATTSIRLYAEAMTRKQRAMNLNNIPIDEKVPCAAARFKYEIMYHPDGILRDSFPNLVQTTDFNRGGHFAALEEPKLLADDIFSAVFKMRQLRK